MHPQHPHIRSGRSASIFLIPLLLCVVALPARGQSAPPEKYGIVIRINGDKIVTEFDVAIRKSGPNNWFHCSAPITGSGCPAFTRPQCQQKPPADLLQLPKMTGPF